MATHRIPKDRKDQILKRIKDDGISVSQAAKEHGVADGTIYNWLSRGVTEQPTLREFSKLKKQHKLLTELVGEMTIALSQSKKKK